MDVWLAWLKFLRRNCITWPVGLQQICGPWPIHRACHHTILLSRSSFWKIFVLVAEIHSFQMLKVNELMLSNFPSKVIGASVCNLRQHEIMKLSIDWLGIHRVYYTKRDFKIYTWPCVNFSGLSTKPMLYKLGASFIHLLELLLSFFTYK